MIGLSSALVLLFGQLAKYVEYAKQINNECVAKGLPPAFEIANDRIVASVQYRFEGFGLVLGFKPKMSFYVHHVPSQTEIGRFLVPITWGDIGKVKG